MSTSQYTLKFSRFNNLCIISASYRLTNLGIYNKSTVKPGCSNQCEHLESMKYITLYVHKINDYKLYKYLFYILIVFPTSLFIVVCIWKLVFCTHTTTFETKTILAIVPCYLTQLPSVLWAERLLMVTPQAKDWPGIIWSSSYLKWTSFTFNCLGKTWFFTLRQIIQVILLQPMGETHIQYKKVFQ